MDEVVAAVSMYDQWDAEVRGLWKNLSAADHEEIKGLRDELKSRGDMGVNAAVLLLWATTTMLKRDMEDRRDFSDSGG